MDRTYQSVLKFGLGLVVLSLFLGLAFSIALQPVATASTIQATNPVVAAEATATPAAKEKKSEEKSGDREKYFSQYLMPVLQAAADNLHLTVAQLEAAVISGKSLSDVAQSQKVDLSTVKTAVLDGLKIQFGIVVKEGKVTQAQADKAIQTADLWFEELAKLNISDFTRLSKLNGPTLFHPILMATANSLNLKPEELIAQLTAGKSLTEIAKGQNVPLQNVKDAVLGSFKVQLDGLVKDKTLTQAQADKATQTANLWWEELVKLSKPAKTNP